ncbi:MAG TPA: YicC family protein [Clostridiaceae bacterium]|nr:YicC family protein [Clostridiaceae bacterium]
MIRSMTGFGRCIYQQDGREFQVEIKTVNHRYTDIFIKMPRNIMFLEDKVRDLISKNLSRGKIDVYILYKSLTETSKLIFLDEAVAASYMEAVKKLRDKYGLKDDISVSLISQFPEVFRVENVQEDEEAIWSVLQVAVQNALDALIKMREQEGETLKKDLIQKAESLESTIDRITLRAPEVVKEYKIKLENRIKELLEQQTIDESRIATEVAFFADRCSIDEELVRLRSHMHQFVDTLNMEQPVGRKLDFLIQEINREVNTIGSKANDLEITKNIIELKSEIEKMREQVQNIE